jgi:hypothetical protein
MDMVLPSQMTSRKPIRVFVAPLAVAFALIPIMASANWQYTRWGMSPEQVVLASKGTARLEQDNGSYIPHLPNGDRALMLAKGQMQISNFDFRVGFYFDEKRTLNSVFLFVERCSVSDAGRLREWLNAKYGVPRQQLYGGITEWVSPFEPDIITFVSTNTWKTTDTWCSVEYEPIPAGL